MLYTTHLAHIAQEKVSPQTNSSYIFLLGMNFKNLTVGLHILLHACKISRKLKINSYTINDISFCGKKLCTKNKFIDQIVNNTRLE